ncbi:hypothetical protein [Paenibacillus crassostreae]|uniref:Uncharacterized protein n=1 Tax=Paenibacillus crassostreae TaxID=1763538 RepID=A0A167AUB0_9BACL|nr:hypothetical protein [Paenibacillus crassostreae]AOZ93609.1 hypothetical protein LPB68_16370 [Paenibacillus crassostreae]OAB71436.1 hypothetical protein PNBC_19240 [Paenibacillus crassostreae]
MKIKTINPTNINRLRIAFENVLLDNGIRYTKVGITEDGDELVFLFEGNDKLHTFKWNKKTCVGHGTEEIAKSVLEPMITRLKGI